MFASEHRVTPWIDDDTGVFFPGSSPCKNPMGTKELPQVAMTEARGLIRQARWLPEEELWEPGWWVAEWSCWSSPLIQSPFIFW